MVASREHKELKNWLDSKPRDIGVAIATRSALRALPFLKAAYDQNYQYANRLTLQTFYACTIAWTGVAGYNRSAAASVDGSAAVVRAAADHASADTAFVYTAAARAADAAHAYTAVAAADAVYAASAVALAVPANLATAANYSAAAFIDDGAAAEAMWRIVREEMNFLEGGGSVEQLMVATMDRIPHSLESADGALKRALNAASLRWKAFKSTLLNQRKDWEVWIDWYEDRLEGRGQNATFEKAFLTLSNEEWKQEPAIVNARLKELMEKSVPDELEPSFGQKPALYVYSYLNEKGYARPFRADHDQQPDQAEVDELLHQARFLFARLGERGLHNTPLVKSFQDVLGRVIDHLSAFNPGALNMAAKVIESHAAEIDTQEAREELPVDVIARAPAFSSMLENFIGPYRELKLIEEEKKKLGINDDEIKALREGEERIRNVVGASPAMDDSVLKSLSVGEAEIKSLQEEKRLELDENKRAAIQLQITSIIKVQLLNFGNFLRVSAGYLSEKSKDFAEFCIREGAQSLKMLGEFFGPSVKRLKKGSAETAEMMPRAILYTSIACILSDKKAKIVLDKFPDIKLPTFDGKDGQSE